MSWLTDTLAVYGRVFRRGLELVVRNWILGIVAVAYQLLLLVLAITVAPLGIVGGVLMTLAMAACASSWLVLVEQVIRSGRTGFRELSGSFAAYLGEVVNIFFLLFVLNLLRDAALSPFPYLWIVFAVATFVFLNAVPELLYLRHQAGVALAVESYRFIGESWVEWLPANVVLVGLALAVVRVVPAGPFGVVSAVVLGFVAAYAFIVRGLLFLELTTSSRRAREFQRRASG